MSETTTYPGLLEALAQQATDADLFESVEIDQGLLKAHARVVESPCWYQIGPLQTVDTTSTVWVGMYTPDRWLSGSIEADVLHMGDKYEDLLEEELIDQGYNARFDMQHFRDDEKQFVFRSAVPVDSEKLLEDPGLAERLFQALCAYEACFRELGDMIPEED
ncbi:MAG: hypothetical protein AAGA25_14035 [Planctomycetota bacterium]